MRINFRILISLIIGLNCFTLTNADTVEDYVAAMNHGSYDKAILIMNDIIKNAETKTGDLYYKRACAYEKKGNYVFAAVDCSTALKYSPSNKEYLLLRGKCKQKVNDPTYVVDLTEAGAEGLALERPQEATPKPQNIKTKRVTPSDVDVNIPVTSYKNDNTFVLIFSIENYMEDGMSKVDYALNDGEKFKEYCVKTLGIPEQNIHFRSDATKNQILSEIKWAKQISEVYGDEAKLLIYYSGHGMPDEKTHNAYILPSDAIVNDSGSGYSLSQLYDELGNLAFNATIVFLDACFSGTKRNGEMLAASRGIAIKPNLEKLKGNVVVISATEGNDTAYPDEENQHGLFTYFLLKKLQETKGNVSIGVLADYLSKQVKRASVVKNLKVQSPTTNYSHESSINLKQIKLVR